MPAICDDFRYVILPARPPLGLAARSICNKAYEHWKTYWQRIFRHKAADFCTPLEFFRQDLVFCLFVGEEIAAQNLATFFHTDDLITLDLPYFQAFRGEAMRLMAAKQAKSVMSIEYTSVSPQFGERRTGLRLGEIVNALALEMFLSKNIDVTVGTPRRLSGLSDVTMMNGYRLIAEGYQKAGWDLDVVLGFKDEIRPHSDPVYCGIIQHLWAHREDYSQTQSSVKTCGRLALSKESEMGSNIRDAYIRTLDQLCIKFDCLNWQSKCVYSAWLSQVFYMVRHTTRLLAVCAGCSPLEQEDMHQRLLEHLQEEKGHDKIALADLGGLGCSLNDLPEFPETKRLVQLQYEQMKDLSACTFFGYILLLEGLAVMRGKKLHDEVTVAFGPRAGRFLKVHAEDDIEHIEQALRQVESLELEDQALVVQNLKLSAAIYQKMLERIEAESREYPSSNPPSLNSEKVSWETSLSENF